MRMTILNIFLFGLPLNGTLILKKYRIASKRTNPKILLIMRNNYIEILTNKVEIPIIQRDYAQGRTDIKTNKIRNDFLTVIFDFLKEKHFYSPDKELELDFIYGFNDDKNIVSHKSFIPIDGQQRLTTLWLLYWLVGAKEEIPF